MSYRACLAAAALALAAAPAQAAGPAPEFGGTWECRLPRQSTPRTPPIIYIQHAKSSDPNKVMVEVDGFGREMAGIGELTIVADGWSRIAPEAGAPFFVRRTESPKGIAAPAMMLRRSEDGPIYRCLRLPLG
jgi:hypothetical protein